MMRSRPSKLNRSRWSWCDMSNCGLNCWERLPKKLFHDVVLVAFTVFLVLVQTDMELVRRRKLCRNIMSVKPKKKLVENKTDGKYTDKRPHTCTNDTSKGHPYEDRIHFTHVLADTMEPATYVIHTLFYEFSIFSAFPGLAPTALHLLQRYNAMDNVIQKIDMEVNYAEKITNAMDQNPNYMSAFIETGIVRIASCGNYRNHLDELIDKANEHIRLSQSKLQKRIHQKKLRIFLALKKVATCLQAFVQ
ncbi:hypothetical protein Btru_072402 [Bulinus truncatus]|nr:hypothetical protein Btru_072402 [Bulinus truncatus]